MASDNTRNKKTPGTVLVALLALFILSTPCQSYSAQPIETIQIGSYLREQGSRKDYNALLKILKEEEKKTLRIRKVGRYYAVRLGLFEHFDRRAEMLFWKIKAYYPGAITLTVNSGNDNIVEIYDATVLPAPEQPVVEPSIAPVERLNQIPVEVSIPIPEPPVEVKTLEAVSVIAPLLKVEDLGPQTAASIQGPQPFLPDSLLIAFTTIISFFMLELYLRNLARLGTFEDLKWLLAGSAAAEWVVARKYVNWPEVGSEIQVQFEVGEMTPVASLVGSGSGLVEGLREKQRAEVVQNEADGTLLMTTTNDSSGTLNSIWSAKDGEFDLDNGRICIDDGGWAAAEEVTGINLKAPENRNLHTVAPRTSPRKRHTGGGADNQIGSSEKAERENRVDRAVLAVSFFADEKTPWD